MDTRNHYENHLAKYYTWIYGGFDSGITENSEFFKQHQIRPESTRIALDLGAGSGFQSLPLAKLGFEVKAVDFSRILLDELKRKSAGLKIALIEGDFMDFDQYSGWIPEVIVCMGDTLTHLDSLDRVKELLTKSFGILSQNGRLILTFRDLTYELKDEKRFIPVRSDEGTIFTCFLEYFPEYLKVFDIVHENVNGNWNQKISFYKKIKIPQDWIRENMINAGFRLELFECKNGLISIIGKK